MHSQQALLQSSHICKVVVVLCCTTSWFCMFCVEFYFPLFVVVKKASPSAVGGIVCTACVWCKHTYFSKYIKVVSTAFNNLCFYPFFQVLSLDFSCYCRTNKWVEKALTGYVFQVLGRQRGGKKSYKPSKNGFWSLAVLSLLCISRSQRIRARFECQSEAYTAQYKPGNFCTVLAVPFYSC